MKKRRYMQFMNMPPFCDYNKSSTHSWIWLLRWLRLQLKIFDCETKAGGKKESCCMSYLYCNKKYFFEKMMFTHFCFGRLCPQTKDFGIDKLQSVKNPLPRATEKCCDNRKRPRLKPRPCLTRDGCHFITLMFSILIIFPR